MAGALLPLITMPTTSLNERRRSRWSSSSSCQWNGGRDLSQCPKSTVSYASKNLPYYDHTPAIHPSQWHLGINPSIRSVKWTCTRDQTTTDFTQEVEEQTEEVITMARKRLNHNDSDPIDTMSLIDTLQRLGIAYHFDEEIESLSNKCFHFINGKHDLFGTSLCFRLLRQQGHNVSSDVFLEFMNNNGSFKEELSKDLKGLKSLYEASHMAIEGEELLSQAMDFSKQHLKASMQYLDPILAQQVGMALAFPRQRTVERFEARRFIEHFSQDFRKNSPIIELATLDFNSVQSLYQKEIIELKRWWRELGLAKKLPFARDRPLEYFLCTVGLFPEPNFSECRIEVAKAVAILFALDDVYDSYGSLDELIVFTDAVQRWDIQAIEHLPEYMKICYMALSNSVNETGYRVLKEHGWFIIPQLTKQWQKICEAYLVEARWFNNEHVPTLEDYLNNGITSVGTYMTLVYAFYLIGKQVTKESADLVNACPKLFHNSGRIFRLWDDLGTAKDEQERGDVASSIEICRKEHGLLSDEDARGRIRGLIDRSWKDLNKEAICLSQLCNPIVKTCLNIARTSQLVYQHGDDERAPSVEHSIRSLLIEPIHHPGSVSP